MLKIATLWNFLLIAPAIAGATLVASNSAMAAQGQLDQPAATELAATPAVNAPAASVLTAVQPVSTPLPLATTPTTSPAPTPVQVALTPQADAADASTIDGPVTGVAALEPDDADLPTASMSQVTSVSQLSDVQPTDWAFQALQSLVERYGVIAGYPDGTFRGNRAMTRYEFAAGLNAAMDRVNELIAAGTADLVTKEDLATLQRLQEEFAAELATLRGRVDALEARTATLEAQQFSTTTKLSALAWFNITGAGSPGKVQADGPNSIFDPAPGSAPRLVDNPATTFSNLVWLTFTTSFTGKDALVTQLVTGNGVSPTNTYASAGLFNTFGVPFTDQTAGPQAFDGTTILGPTRVVLKDFFYSFPVTNSIQAIVGPQVNWYRYFDNNRFTFFLFGAGSFNSSGSTLLNSLDRGSGAVVLWKITPQLEFRTGYLGGQTEFLQFPPYNSASNPGPGLGLFGGINTLTAELTYNVTPDAAVRFLYNRSNILNSGGSIATEPIYGIVRDIGGGPLNNATADTLSVNFDWLITKGIGLFGRYGFASADIYRPTGGRAGSINAQSYQVGLAFPDLGKPGAQAVFSFLVPYTLTNGRQYFVSGAGNGGKQYEFEFSYYYPISDNVAIVPSFYIIGEPNNYVNNPPIYVGNFRTQFSF